MRKVRQSSFTDKTAGFNKKGIRKIQLLTEFIKNLATLLESLLGFLHATNVLHF